MTALRNIGIEVDVHVHHITNYLKWHKPLSKNPEEMWPSSTHMHMVGLPNHMWPRLNLQLWLFLNLHCEINHLLIRFNCMLI